MKKLLLVTFLAFLALIDLCSCSSQQPRTKWTDPQMRVMIDPESIDVKNFVRIQQALVRTRRFFVVDRGKGFKAVVNEQNLEHVSEPDRFGDQEKYARMAKLYGVGGIITANIQCGMTHSYLWGDKMKCVQYLALVNAVTAEVVAAIEQDAEAVSGFNTHVALGPSWDEAVDKLMGVLPTHFEKIMYDSRMKLYRREVAEDAQRQRDGQRPVQEVDMSE